MKRFLFKSEQYLQNIAKVVTEEFPQESDLVNMTTVITGITADIQGDNSTEKGDHVGHINVELSPADTRTISNHEIIKLWQQKIGNPKGVESLTISFPKSGPPGRDIDIQLTGATPLVLKQAANKLTHILQSYQGVLNIKDNLPYGKEQLSLELKASAIAHGLTRENLALQLSNAFSGMKIESFTHGNDQVDVRVMLADKDKYSLSSLDNFPIKLPNGKMIPLGQLINIQNIKGFDILRHDTGNLTVKVTAEVNTKIANANKILAQLQQTTLEKLKQEYNINYYLGGRSEEQQKTLSDMMFGLIIGLLLIYVILAAVFSSYAWPIIVMVMIPLGLTGAVIGHLIMGYDLTILSLFGLFGLAGIVINDSIILVSFYKDLKKRGIEPYLALIEAVRSRFRPVLLTSITTIAGLTPLLFETSLQAKFLIPMAISIVFGLGFSTLLILFVLPAMLACYERV